MGKIHVDKERLARAEGGVLDSKDPALWTFSIQNEDICFWGTFPEAAHTATLYAERHGMIEGAIKVLDCMGASPLRTVH
ncbi:MAG TPA: hypothetical protein PKI11_06910 [Candidatus Hydrogenedentes bacterium]|nr:hypothetical protein [Candidatus Hydrogenedentota bacterium]